MYLNRIHTATFLPFRAYNTDNQLIIDTVHVYYTHFNSIKVQLKPAVGAAGNVVSAFQFHKGTIKTLP